MTAEGESAALELMDGARLRTALHDMSQPLSTLECMLYVQKVMAEKAGRKGLVAKDVAQTMDQALRECERMMGVMRLMQDSLSEPKVSD